MGNLIWVILPSVLKIHVCYTVDLYRDDKMGLQHMCHMKDLGIAVIILIIQQNDLVAARDHSQK